MDAIPVDLFLAGHPDGIQRQAERLRTLVKAGAPEAIECVRPGWRLIGYDLPSGRRTRFFAWIWVEPIHVHLGFQYGAWMRDPDRRLEGAHLRLRKVRFLIYAPGAPIPRRRVLAFLSEAALVARLSAPERASRALDAGWAPELHDTTA